MSLSIVFNNYCQLDISKAFDLSLILFNRNIPIEYQLPRGII